ncbi:MAG TPA: hypothetical protein VF175_18585, partial [Lacipirellula sp.]
VVRFRLSTMLLATTAAVVLAAIAGIYYNQQTPEGQRSLLLVWPPLVVYAAVAFVWYFRAAVKPPRKLGEIHFRASVIGPGYLERLLAPLIAAAATLVLIGGNTQEAVKQAESMHGRTLLSFLFFNDLLLGLGVGVMTAYFLSKQPVWICEDGVKHVAMSVRWKRFREVAWRSSTKVYLRIPHHRALRINIKPEDVAQVRLFLTEKVSPRS